MSALLNVVGSRLRSKALGGARPSASLLDGRLSCTDAIRRGMIARTHFLPNGLLLRGSKCLTIFKNPIQNGKPN